MSVSLAASPAGDLLQSDRTLRKPLAIDLFCGLGGWAEGLLAEGYDVVGFDNHRHAYMMPESVHVGDGGKGTKPVEKRGWTQGCAITLGMEGATSQPRTRLAHYPAQLVLQDVLTIHGSQFRDAAVIVASPPCQNYSYLAMPWSRSQNPNNSKAAKALRLKWETEGPDNRLFDACFRIQREAIAATAKPCSICLMTGRKPMYAREECEACYGSGMVTRYIPLIIENVRGAQPWVGRSAWNYGSFHLWGDVPALMPFSQGRKRTGRNFHTHALTNGAVSSPSFHGGEHETRGVGLGVKIPAYSEPRRNGGKGVHLTSPAENRAAMILGQISNDR